MSSSNAVDTAQPRGAITYKRLLKYLKPFRGTLVLSIVGMVVYAVAEMGVVALFKELVDDNFIERSQDNIHRLPLLFLGVFLLRAIGNFLSKYFLAYVGRGVIRNLRSQMFNKLLVLPTYYYDERSSGEMVSTFTYNVERVADSITSSILTIVQDSCVVIAMLAYMFYQNALLSAVFFLAGPLVGVIIYLVSSRFRLLHKRLQGAIGQVTQVVDETIEGQQVIKVFGGQQAAQKLFEKVNDRIFNQNMKLTVAKTVSEPVIQFIAAFTLVGVIYLSSSGAVGEVTAGMFAAYILALTRIFQPLKRLTNVNPVLQNGIAAAQSIFDLIDAQDEPVRIHQNRATAQYPKVQGSVCFENLSFRYRTSQNNILTNINLQVEPGQTLALVGRSGSGKSTLVSLLPRFYDPTEGRITVDGKDSLDYSLTELRAQISFVSQNIVLFNDTIANNIAFGELAGTDYAQIEAVAKAAYVWEFVQNLPDGLDTHIGENGVLLSGGQRQRLAIARALLKDSPILILDEATSALDSESEAHIQKALDNLMRNRTTFVIAHRLSTIESADRIAVMDQGRIIECGSHDELLHQGEAYAGLQGRQSGGASDRSSGLVLPGQASLPRLSLTNVSGFNTESQKATDWLSRMWYEQHMLYVMLAPFTALFSLVTSLRRMAYRTGLMNSESLPVPVIVVGNITVGGTGKTPLILWLAEWLQQRGFKPGIISRGYRSKARQYPKVVDAQATVEEIGDEAALIRQRLQIPMVIGPDRIDDGQLLLKTADCDIILSDDGLQHYRLQRAIEIAVIDGFRGLGNGLQMPAGPLREPRSRLDEVDLIVATQATAEGAYTLQFQAQHLQPLQADLQPKPLQKLLGQTVHAVAGIGNPNRFYDTLRQAGLQVVEHTFPDHHAFTADDFEFDDAGFDQLPVIMTEKDAVKCDQLDLPDRLYWYLPVTTVMGDDFKQALEQLLQKKKIKPSGSKDD